VILDRSHNTLANIEKCESWEARKATRVAIPRRPEGQRFSLGNRMNLSLDAARPPTYAQARRAVAAMEIPVSDSLQVWMDADSLRSIRICPWGRGYSIQNRTKEIFAYLMTRHRIAGDIC
jgi:hypothetical protein